MTITNELAALKAKKKELANEIRRLRSIRQDKTKTIKDRNKTAYEAYRAGQQFRLLHIADCMIRGRTYKQIEPRVSESNMLREYQWRKINQIAEHYGHDNACFGPKRLA